MRALWSSTAVVRAPVDAVARVLTDVRPGPDGAWLLTDEPGTRVTGGPRVFRVSAPGHAMTVEVGELAVAVQGGWWYRGEYGLAPQADGTTLLTHRVFDVARRARWAVPLVLLQYRRSGAAGPAATARATAALARRLERAVAD